MVQVKQDMNRALGRQLAEEATALGIKHRCIHQLIDVRESRNTEGPLENYSFAYDDLGKIAVDRRARTAILVSPGDNSHDFIEVVGRNAGYSVRLFTEEDKAIAWLEEASSAATRLPPADG